MVGIFKSKSKSKSKSKYRTLLTICLITLVLLLGSCGKKYSPEEEALRKNSSADLKVRSDLNLALQIMPRHLHPALPLTMAEKSVVDQLYEGLVTLKNNKIKLVQAETLEPDADFRIWQCKLRADLKWSDGTAITADDYRRSWLEHMKLEPENLQAYLPDKGENNAGQPDSDRQAEAFRALPIQNADRYIKGEVGAEDVGIKADGLVLTVTLTEGDKDFSKWLTQSFFYPTKEAKGEPLYNGAYVLQSAQPESLVLTANRNYWDLPNLWIRNVNFSIISDEIRAYEEYHNKNLDMIGEPFYTIGKDRRTAAAKAPEKLIFPVQRLGYIRLLNLQHKLFDSPAKRRTLYELLDAPFQSRVILQDESEVWPERETPNSKYIAEASDFFQNSFTEKELEDFTEDYTYGLAGPTILENRLLVACSKDWLQALRVKFRLLRVVDDKTVLDFIYQTKISPDGSKDGLLKALYWQGEIKADYQALYGDSQQDREYRQNLWQDLAADYGIMPLHERAAMLLVNPQLIGIEVDGTGKLLISNLQWRPFDTQ